MDYKVKKTYGSKNCSSNVGYYMQALFMQVHRRNNLLIMQEHLIYAYILQS